MPWPYEEKPYRIINSLRRRRPVRGEGFPWGLPEIIKAFKQACPKVSLELHQKTSAEQIED